MTVNTAKVTGRRELRFASLDEVLADAERLVKGPSKTLGNWSLGQILKHLAAAMDMAVDGLSAKPPWIMRQAARLMKNRMLNKGLSPGFQLPRSMAKTLVVDDGTTPEEGLAALRTAIDRYKSAGELKPHPAFGPLSRTEWDKLHLRHSELHLSFVVPE